MYPGRHGDGSAPFPLWQFYRAALARWPTAAFFLKAEDHVILHTPLLFGALPWGRERAFVGAIRWSAMVPEEPTLRERMHVCAHAWTRRASLVAFARARPGGGMSCVGSGAWLPFPHGTSPAYGLSRRLLADLVADDRIKSWIETARKERALRWDSHEATALGYWLSYRADVEYYDLSARVHPRCARRAHAPWLVVHVTCGDDVVAQTRWLHAWNATPRARCDRRQRCADQEMRQWSPRVWVFRYCVFVLC